jgi:hypothetical protein
MNTYSLGMGTTSEFVDREYAKVNLKDARLNKRAKDILKVLQNKLGSCIRRVFTNAQEARQAYDFFW